MIRYALVCKLYTALLLTLLRPIFNLMAHVESDVSSKELQTWKVMWLHSLRHLKISFIKSVPWVQFSNYLDRKSLNSMYWQVTVSCTCANFSNFKRRGKSIFLKKSLHKKMKLSIKDFFSKWDQIRRKLHIWSHLPKKSLRENFIFCVVWTLIRVSNFTYKTRIVRPCTNLHSAPFSSTQLHPADLSLLRYKNQNIARNCTNSPSLGQKIKSCPF